MYTTSVTKFRCITQFRCSRCIFQNSHLLNCIYRIFTHSMFDFEQLSQFALVQIVYIQLLVIVVIVVGSATPTKRLLQAPSVWCRMYKKLEQLETDCIAATLSAWLHCCRGVSRDKRWRERELGRWALGNTVKHDFNLSSIMQNTSWWFLTASQWSNCINTHTHTHTNTHLYPLSLSHTYAFVRLCASFLIWHSAVRMSEFEMHFAGGC